MRPVDRLVFAIDVPAHSAARGWLERLRGEVGVMKVGLQLFIAEGPAVVNAVHRHDYACFLDLKLYDIPATVEYAVQSAVDLGVRFLTVHASAGPRALERAARAREGSHTQLLAVTALTSFDDAELAAVGFSEDSGTLVERLARLASASGIDGFICAPNEARRIRAIAGDGACVITPGVRPTGVTSDDQRRVATPSEAIRNGAERIVVGRPIRNAADPAAMARAIVAEIAVSVSEP